MFIFIILFNLLSFTYSNTKTNTNFLKSKDYNNLYLFDSKNIKKIKTYKQIRKYEEPSREFSISYNHFVKFMPIDFYGFALSFSCLDTYNISYTLMYDFYNNDKYFTLAYFFFLTDRGKDVDNLAFFFGGGIEFSDNTYLFPRFGLRLSRRAISNYLGVNFDISYEYRNSQSKENRFVFTLGFLFKI